jgi:hypothetical protein
MQVIVRRGLGLSSPRNLIQDGWHGSSIGATLDMVPDRCGSSAITRGVLLGHREGLRIPLLPDWR